MLLEDFTFKNVQSRLIKLLLNFSSLKKGNEKYICTLSQNEMASLLGTCREVVSRSLKKLKQEGLIDILLKNKQNRIIINDYSRLKERNDQPA